MRSLWFAVALAVLPAVLVAQEPTRFRVRGLNGAPAPFAATTSGVRVVNVWAPWCGPCVAELPSLQALADSLRNDGVAVLTLTGARENAVSRFMARSSIRLLVLLEHDALPSAWEVSMLPTTLVLDAEGRVLERHRGARRWDDAATVARLRGLARAGARR